MAQHPGIHLCAYHQDPLQQLCQALLEQQRARLPDLSHVTILLAEPHAAPRLRQHLLQQLASLGYAGVIGLQIMGLRDWARQYLPEAIRVCNDVHAELTLVEALEPHHHLFNQASPWLVAKELRCLFDELTLHEIGLPDGLSHFIGLLHKAYGVQHERLAALGKEATIVHTLWHAWHTQLQQQGLHDAQSAYLLALRSSLERIPQEQQLWLAGFERFYPAERSWLKTLLARQQAQLVVHGQAGSADYPHPDSVLEELLRQLEYDIKPAPPTQAYESFMDCVFNTDTQPLQQRAQQFAQRHPRSPLQQRLHIALTASAEQEARCIDIQVRRWLLQGKQHIGIVTENRRLARRVRALLERADIALQDAAGWAMSTTSAAATVERWLECIEEDFAHQPMLDLLKSPFVFAEFEPERVKLASYRLEQDIIRHENIARGLQRYRAHIIDRQQRLPDWLPGNDQLLLALLEQLEEASRSLTALLTRKFTAHAFMTGLLDSLRILGMNELLQQDAAGGRLLQILEQLAQHSRHSPLLLNWSGARTWLGRHLEQFNFQPRQSEYGVQLLGLAQSRLQQFDALIIAGAERDYLPGHVAVSPFFNDQVRQELGLTGRFQFLAERLYHIRRLLSSAAQILVTARQEQDGEAIVLSPWLENLLSVQQQAYALSLTDNQLLQLSEQPASQVIRCTDPGLPEQQRQPRPRINPALLPDTFSPTDYQQLLNCPYQYYAARCLKLSPPEEISEALSKADYGERIHLCLQAFHGHVTHLPGPFGKPITEQNRLAAITLLQDISRQVFADVLADNFQHQAWLSQWLAFVPAYIDWQAARQQQGRVSQVEQRYEAQLTDTLTIKGRLDRIDELHDQLCIIDYKTGSIPKQEDVLNGEYIQLPFYALLEQTRHPQHHVHEVAYLQFDKPDKLKFNYSISADELATLADAIAQRLISLVEELHTDRGVPAWGDSKTCAYCQMHLLCRKQVWEQ